MKQIRRLLTAIAVLGFLCLPALATTRYAAASGGVTIGSCTVQANPCTLAYALTVYSGGDTLQLASGTYTDFLIDKIPSGSAGNPTILKSETPLGAIIKPSGATSDTVLWIGAISGKSYITVDGLDIDASTVTPDSRSVGISNSDNITVKNSKLHGGRGHFAQGGGADGTSSNNLYQNNEVYDVADNGSPAHQYPTGCCATHGYYISAGGVTLEDNNIHDIPDGYGIHFHVNVAVTRVGNIARRNRIHVVGNSLCGAPCGGITFDHQQDLQVVNNLIYASDGTKGIVEDGNNSTGNKVWFNTIVNNANADCIQTVDSSGLEVRNNICQGNSFDGISDGNASTVASNNRCDVASDCNKGGGSNSITSTFTFANAGTGDLHITANDNHGVAVSVTTDYYSQSRSNPPDIGAAEFVPTGGTGVTNFNGSGVIR